MRIAQLAQICVPVPPAKYGGTELIISLLTEELVRRGHKVTLFAAGDSKTSAKLHYSYKTAVGIEKDTPITELASVSEAFSYIKNDGNFDIIHNHAGWWGITLAQYAQIPIVTTLHNDYLPLGTPAFEYFKNSCYYVAISENQKRLNAGLNFAGVVYNAIDTGHYQVEEQKNDYLLFFGNICKEKGVDTAVKVAKDLNKNLILSGKIDKGPQQDFFEAEVKPDVDGKQIIYYPPVDHKTKQAFFAQAKCFLFPIDWEEPFGLVMLEAMASGTPVVAYKRGSVPEVIRDGKTGFVVESYEAFLAAVKKIGHISPDDCRRHVEKYFSVKTMTDNYLAVYEKILGISKSSQFCKGRQT